MFLNLVQLSTMISYIYCVTKIIVDDYYLATSSSPSRHYIFFEDDDGTNQRMLLSTIDGEISTSGLYGDTLTYESAGKIFVDWDDDLPEDDLDHYLVE